MNLESFELLVKSEVRARQYIARICWHGGHRFCPQCNGRKVYKVRRQKYRCKHCWYEFNDWSGRWIGQLRITARDWLRIVKLFELELSAHKAAGQIGLSYPTVLKAFNLIRKSIAAASEDGMLLLGGEVEADESYFGGRRKGHRGRGAAGKVPVFGILERQGLVKVEVVRQVSAEILLDMTVKMVRRGSIVYTDKFGSYDALMFCGYRHLQVDHQRRFSSGKVYINGLEGFWSYAKERLIKHHGVSKTLFPFYLKEMQFRYNHRHDNLFNLLLNSLCLLVANRL